MIKKISMGKGDKKTKRGKIVIGSYGVRRIRKKKRVIAPLVKIKIEPKIKETKVKEEKKIILIEPVVEIQVSEAVEEKVTKKAPAKKSAKKAVVETAAPEIKPESKPKVAKTRKKSETSDKIESPKTA